MRWRSWSVTSARRSGYACLWGGFCQASQTVLSCTITFGWGGCVFCQCHEACKECSSFGLWPAGSPCDSSESLQLSHRLGVEAKPKHPDLAAVVIVGRCGVQGEGEASILVRAYGLELFPHTTYPWYGWTCCRWSCGSRGIQPFDHRASSLGW